MRTQDKHISLSIKMIVIIVVLLLLPLTVCGSYLYSTTTSKLFNIDKTNLVNSTQAVHKLLAEQGSQLLNITKSNSHWTDARTAALHGDAAWIKENINSQVGIVHNLDFVSTADLNGKVISQQGDVPTFEHQITDTSILDKLAKESDFSGLIDTPKGLAVVAVSKITDESGTRTPTGILVFGHFLNHADVLQIKDVLQLDVGLSSNSGRLTTASDLDHVTGGNYTASQPLFNLLVQGRTKVGRVELPLLGVANKPIGTIIAERDLSASSQVQHDFTSTSIFIAVVVLLLLGLLVYAFSVVVARPLKTVTKTLQRVANGTLTLDKAALHTNRKDEIGIISQATEQMVQNLRMMVQSVSNLSTNLSASSEEIFVATDSSKQTVAQVAGAIEAVAHGSANQVVSVESGMQVLGELQTAVDRIVLNAEQVSARASNASQMAVDGDRAVQSSLNQMQLIHGKIGDMSTVTLQLHERSREIETITDAITTFATQTNLLALNAAIESARAGEHGRGFAVVADEVRKLAEQSAASAESIGESIRLIQKDIERAVESMQVGQREVEIGLNVVREAGNSFEEIKLSVDEVANQMQSVLQASQDLSGSTQLSDAIRGIEQVALTNASGMQEVSSATEEQLATIEDIAASMQRLSELSHELQNSVEKFTLE